MSDAEVAKYARKLVSARVEANRVSIEGRCGCSTVYNGPEDPNDFDRCHAHASAWGKQGAAMVNLMRVVQEETP